MLLNDVQVVASDGVYLGGAVNSKDRGLRQGFLTDHAFPVPI